MSHNRFSLSRSWRLVACAAAFQFVACAADSPDDAAGAGAGANVDPGGANVDPGDANALSEVLVIPGAVRVTGAPPAPAPSGSAEAPTITAIEPEITVMSGKQGVLRISFASKTGYKNCFGQVLGADDYFRIAGDDATTDGELQIPVNVPGGVCSGTFSFYACIAGSNGLVSNAITASFSVSNPGACGDSSGESGDTCAAACQRIVDNAPCYAAADGLASCLDDCGQNMRACPTQTSAVNACVVRSTPGCDADGSLTIAGCEEEAQAVRDCSGDSAY